MKIIKFICILFISLLLVACNNNSKVEEDSSTKTEKLPNIPKNVFSNNSTNENISEKDLKKDLKKYLDTFDSLEKNASHIRNKENLKEEDKEKLNDIHSLMSKNNNNFKQYINKNNLPQNYKNESTKIYNYLHSAEQLINELSTETEKAMNDNSSNKEKLKATGNIKKINSKYKDRVNGKKEKEIKEFLNKHNIKTEAFE